jgi:hypothetical protein
MNSKDKLKFIEKFSYAGFEEMQKVIKILQNTAEAKRIKDEIAHFDSVRLDQKATIETIECYATGGDPGGEYEDFKIRLRFKPEEP